MAHANRFQSIVERSLLSLAPAVARFGYPVRWERMGIDDNRSLWAASTPDYVAQPTLNGEVDVDLAIIGGGFTGVSTAWHFSRRYPDKRVALLEARLLANGASGRNGGMMLNWIYGVGPIGDELTRNIYHHTQSTIDWIESTIAAHNLDVSYRRDGCLSVFTDTARAEAAHAEAEHLATLGIPIRYLDSRQAAELISMRGVRGALFDPTEGQLNGAQFVRALRPLLLANGVAVYENTPVLKVEEGPQITLTTPSGVVRARAIVLATNAYTGKLGYFRKSFFPLHSHVFATEPLTAEQQAQLGWHATAGYADDLNRLSYATLTRDGRIVFGGGSNRSYAYRFNNGTAYPGSPASAAAAFQKMQQTLDGYLPGSNSLRLAHRWTGTLAITLRRNCSIGVRGEYNNIYYALGYSGHGVVAANLAGKILTDLYSGERAEWQALPFVDTGFTPIPLEPFRWIGYQMMTRLTGRSPRAH